MGLVDSRRRNWNYGKKGQEQLCKGKETKARGGRSERLLNIQLTERNAYEALG